MNRFALWTAALAIAALGGARVGAAGMPSGAALPKEHPPIPGDPLRMSPDAKGTLIIQGVQGTRGGPAIANDEVTVELNHNGQAIKKVETKLDDHGLATLEGLPVGMGVRPVITVRHAGGQYAQVGEFMRPSPPDNRVTVVLYEATDQAPAWVIRARHIMVRRIDEGLYVKDMLVVESPTDRAWLGRPDGKGGRSTLELQLGTNTGRVDFYTGFHAGHTELSQGRLINRMALVPGTSQFQFGYVVPVTGGKATIEIDTPADTDQLVLVVPDDGSTVAITGGLAPGEPMEMGPQKVRLYQADKMKAGAKAGATLSGLAGLAPASVPARAPMPVNPHPKDGSGSLPQTIAVVGGGAVLAGGLGLICLKRPKPSPKGRG